MDAAHVQVFALAAAAAAKQLHVQGQAKEEDCHCAEPVEEKRIAGFLPLLLLLLIGEGEQLGTPVDDNRKETAKAEAKPPLVSRG